LPQRSLGKSVHLNRPGKKHNSELRPAANCRHQNKKKQQFLVSFTGKTYPTFWAYFIWLTKDVATIRCCCAKLMLFTIGLALWHRGLKHYILYCIAYKMTTSKRHYKPCVHWMDCACLVHKRFRRYYYKKGVYEQFVRSTLRRYFGGQQHVAAWKCIYPKNKIARNRGNLTKRTSELHEKAINFKKDCNAIVF